VRVGEQQMATDRLRMLAFLLKTHSLICMSRARAVNEGSRRATHWGRLKGDRGKEATGRRAKQYWG
jgi:hypothetical protein